MSYWNLKKVKNMTSRLERPWILFPYKSLKSEIALSLKHLLPWPSSYRNLLILGFSRDTNYLFYLCMCMIKIRTRLYDLGLLQKQLWKSVGRVSNLLLLLFVLQLFDFLRMLEDGWAYDDVELLRAIQSRPETW